MPKLPSNLYKQLEQCKKPYNKYREFTGLYKRCTFDNMSTQQLTSELNQFLNSILKTVPIDQFNQFLNITLESQVEFNKVLDQIFKHCRLNGFLREYPEDLKEKPRPDTVLGHVHLGYSEKYMFHLGLYLDENWNTVASTTVFKGEGTAYLKSDDINKLLNPTPSIKRFLSHFLPNSTKVVAYPIQKGSAYLFRGYQAHASYPVQKGDGIRHALVITSDCNGY